MDDLVQQDMLNDEAAALLRAVIHSPYGVVIVGDSESGKTTLLSALLALLPGDSLISVERAGEMTLPQGARRLMPQWSDPPVTFGAQILAALAQQPTVLALDEVRADEPQTIAPLLSSDSAPRLIWSFRSSPDAKRLSSALGMLARRADPSQADRLASALYTRLPFVVTVRRFEQRLQLRSIAEWQGNSEQPQYVLLMERREGTLVHTETPPSRPLTR